MGKKRVLCCYGIDIDAVAGWLGSYGSEDSESDISRGLFAGHVGVPRMLKMLDKYGIKEIKDMNLDYMVIHMKTQLI
ncbi:unnamed protein product [[Candida] boidinii]|nr:unnamed protein product [[Candida] boidinii]